MVKLFLAVLLGFSFAWAQDQTAKTVDPDTLAMDKRFLKVPTQNLPPEHIQRFLDVDPKALPKKLRSAYRAKKIELYALKKVAKGKKKGTVRLIGDECAMVQGAAGQSAKILMMAGFVEITEDEEAWVMHRTNCTERDLLCEFSLQIVVEHHQRRLFLHQNDPLNALIGQYREQGDVKQTNFFGVGGPTCLPQSK